MGTRVLNSRLDRDFPSYLWSLEHLLRYRDWPAFALERLSVIGDEESRVAQVRYVLSLHKRADYVGSRR